MGAATFSRTIQNGRAPWHTIAIVGAVIVWVVITGVAVVQNGIAIGHSRAIFTLVIEFVTLQMRVVSALGFPGLHEP